MQCKSCGSEWKTNTRAGIMIRCPFCGEELEQEKEDKLENQRIAAYKLPENPDDRTSEQHKIVHGNMGKERAKQDDNINRYIITKGTFVEAKTTMRVSS